MHGQKPGLGNEIQWDGCREREHGDEGDGDGEAEGLRPPVEAVEVEDLGYPYQGSQVVEAVVDKKKEPEVHLDACFAVARDPVSVALPRPIGVVRGFIVAVVR